MDETNSFAGVKIRKYPMIKETYIGHWRINFKPTIAFILLLQLVYAYVCFNIVPFVENGASVKIKSLVFHVLIFYLHVMIIYEGPGYLPHDYPNHEKGSPTIALCQSHADLAAKTKMKGRTMYVRQERRFVIQHITADMISGTSVGKRNCKLYIWRTLSLLLYLFYIASYTAKSIIGIIYVYNLGMMLLGSIVAFILIVASVISILINFITVLNVVLLNTRSNPDLYNTDFIDDRSVIEHLKDVLGWNVLLWLVPIPAFLGKTDEELYINHGI